MSKPQKFVRSTFTLPPQLTSDIEYVARRSGVSQSAFVAQMLEAPLKDMRGLMEQVPEDTSTLTPVAAKRLRGASITMVANRVADAVRSLAEHDE